MKKVFKVNKGKIAFRQEMEFDSVYKELVWKFQMKFKGCKLKEIK